MESENLTYYDGTAPPFKVYGLVRGGSGRLQRLPDNIKTNVNEGVTELADYTAGGRVRFRTDSAVVSVAVVPLHGNIPVNMSLIGMTGCDIYADGVYRQTVRPLAEGGEYEESLEKEPTEADIEINLPLYNGVTGLKIGLTKNSAVGDAAPYAGGPILFYGSSITQGSSASRPGNAYTSIVSRRLKRDHINLGFSGSGRGEAIVAEYIGGLELGAFVMDYDHNAPDAEHLSRTHEAFFKIVRSMRPLLPVLFISKPDTDRDPSSGERRDIIYKTYTNAKNAGDTRVYFIDGGTLFGGADRDACTVDGSHPNDLGFMRMADVITPVLKNIFAGG